MYKSFTFVIGRSSNKYDKNQLDRYESLVDIYLTNEFVHADIVFYVLCSFKTWVIRDLHSILSFINSEQCLFTTTSILCSANHWKKLVKKITLPLLVYYTPMRFNVFNPSSSLCVLMISTVFFSYSIYVNIFFHLWQFILKNTSLLPQVLSFFCEDIVQHL